MALVKHYLQIFVYKQFTSFCLCLSCTSSLLNDKFQRAFQNYLDYYLFLNYIKKELKKYIMRYCHVPTFKILKKNSSISYLFTILISSFSSCKRWPSKNEKTSLWNERTNHFRFTPQPFQSANAGRCRRRKKLISVAIYDVRVPACIRH